MSVSSTAVVPAVRSLHWFLIRLCEHRERYTGLGKAEWWWIFEDTLADVAACLNAHHMVWLDGFLLPSQVIALRSEVEAAKRRGLLKTGVLGGGRLGSTLGYVHEKVRGDLMAWFNGDERECNWVQLPLYGKKVGTVVSELANLIPELSHTTARSKYMMTCYPGEGTRYTRHCDNANGNGRRLTALIYLNPDWKHSDGGCLRVYEPDGVTQRFDVEPLGGRLVLFWSDKRVPHEVLPAYVDRYCVTVWFFDTEERRKAEADAADEAAREAEEARVRKEMSDFEQQFGSSATSVHVQAVFAGAGKPTLQDSPQSHPPAVPAASDSSEGALVHPSDTTADPVTAAAATADDHPRPLAAADSDLSQLTFADDDSSADSDD